MRSRGLLSPVLLCALALAGCRSPQERAANAAARADYYATNGDFRDASIEMGRAVGMDEDQPAYWQALAHYNLRLGDVHGAYGAFQHVYELQRDNVEALEWLAELSIAGGDLSNGQTYLDSLLVLQPNDLRGRIAKGEMALKRDHYEEALSLADGVLKDDPNAGDAAVLKSNALEKLGKPAEAAAVLEARVDASGPGASQMLARLVDLYTAVGDQAGLRRTYGRMARLDPADLGSGLKYAGLLGASGDKAGAIRTVRDIQAKHPGDAGAQVGALEVVRAVAGQAAARDEARRIAQAQPQLRGAIAGYLVDDGDAADARDLVAPLVSGRPVTAANVDAQVAYAAALRALGQAPQARAVLDRVIAFDSGNEHALVLRTQIELAAHDLDRALADARLAVDSNPQAPDAALLLAAVYAARNNDTMARGTFANALNTFPDNEQVLDSFVGYLGRVRALGQALAVTDSFTRANPKSARGWAIRRIVCAAAHNGSCVAQATAAMNGHPPHASSDQDLAA